MAKKEAAKRTVLGIGAFAKQLILDGKSNAEVLEAVKKKFPTCNANAGTIGWYRNDLKSKGKKVKASRDITKAAAKAKAPAAKKKAAKKTDAPAPEVTTESQDLV